MYQNKNLKFKILSRTLSLLAVLALLCQGVYANTVEGDNANYDAGSWDNGYSWDAGAGSYDVPVAADAAPNYVVDWNSPAAVDSWNANPTNTYYEPAPAAEPVDTFTFAPMADQTYDASSWNNGYSWDANASSYDVPVAVDSYTPVDVYQTNPNDWTQSDLGGEWSYTPVAAAEPVDTFTFTPVADQTYDAGSWDNGFDWSADTGSYDVPVAEPVVFTYDAPVGQFTGQVEPPNYVVDWNNPVAVDSWNLDNPTNTYNPAPAAEPVDFTTMANDWLNQPLDFGYTADPVDVGISPAIEISSDPAINRVDGFLDNALLAVTTAGGLVPWSDQKAAQYKAEHGELPYMARPWGSSPDGLSAINPGSNHGFTVSGYLTNDLLHPNADHGKIAALNQQYVNMDAYTKYTNDTKGSPLSFTDWKANNLNDPQIQAQYKEAGAISIFAGGGNGEILIDQLPEQGEVVDYYALGEYDDQHHYSGKIEGALMDMALYPENATVSSSEIPKHTQAMTNYNMVKPGEVESLIPEGLQPTIKDANGNDLIVGISEGTVVEVAPNTFVTAAHVLTSDDSDDYIQMSNLSPTDKIENVTPIEFSYVSSTVPNEKFTSYNKGALLGVKDIDPTLGIGSAKGDDLVSDLTNYLNVLDNIKATSEAVGGHRDGSVFVTKDTYTTLNPGDSIPIIPVANSLPEKDDSLTSYFRPMAHQGQILSPYTQETTEIHLPASKSNTDLYEVDFQTTHGRSGSGVYSIDQNNNIILEGVASKGLGMDVQDVNTVGGIPIQNEVSSIVRFTSPVRINNLLSDSSVDISGSSPSFKQSPEIPITIIGIPDSN